MNDEALRQARTNLYLRMASRLIRALTPYLGLRPDKKAIAKVSRPYVISARKQAQDIAYRDYLKFIENKNPVPKMDLKRFTDELWDGTINKVAEDTEILGSDQVQELAMKADYWARDAEWGQRVDVAKKDPRIQKVARVDFKPPTCPFCTLLNSRGADYLSMESAARTLHEGDTCSLIWVKAGQKDYPGHESTAQALERYNRAKEELGTAANTSTILKELANQNPDRPEGSVRKNAREASKTATAAKLRETQARIATLEKINPKSESARKYRDEQLARNQEILKALEGTTNA